MRIIFQNHESIDKPILSNIRSMIRFACKWYLSKDFLKTLEVEVIFDYELNNSGECSPTIFCDYPNFFEIILNPDELKNEEEEFYKTVMHECVHLKQYALNELYDCEKSTVYKGKRFVDKVDKKHKNEPKNILLTPWEIEAYGSELGLLRQWEWKNEYCY